MFLLFHLQAEGAFSNPPTVGRQESPSARSGHTLAVVAGKVRRVLNAESAAHKDLWSLPASKQPTSFANKLRTCLEFSLVVVRQALTFCSAKTWRCLVYFDRLGFLHAYPNRRKQSKDSFVSLSSRFTCSAALLQPRGVPLR